MPDLVVIGAGLTGLSAALTAAQAGLSVRVIAKGMGALHWSAGTIDAMGYTPAGEPVDHPIKEIEQLTAPHPYTLMGADGVREALTWFKSVASSAGVELQQAGTDETNVWLPSPAGAKRPAYLVPSAQCAGDLSQDKPMVIVGFDGLRDLYPDLIAMNLAKQGVAARADHMPVNVITDRIDFNNVHLANALDNPVIRESLGENLAKLAQENERIGLPAILGNHNHAETMSDLRSLTGTDIFEIPTLPPSVPGIRLHRALSDALRALNVRVEIGMEVINFHTEDGIIRWLETETSARPLRHRAATFLLATGGVLGGGFDGDVDGRFWETIFDLPLAAPETRSGWLRSEFLDPRGQPIFKAGVMADDRFKPLDANGGAVYENLWCAGGLLAHADHIRERSLEGLSVASGRAAALALISEFNKNHVKN